VTEADRAACTLAESYIGYTGKLLFQEVRETRGLAYIVFGGCDAGRRKIDEADLYAYAGTQSDKAHDALDAMLAALRRPIDPTRFALSRDALAQGHRAARIPPRELARLVYTWQDEGERADPRAARMKRVLDLDQAALEKWLAAAIARPLIVSITGDRKHLDDARLGALAPVTWVPVPKLFGY
jgi:predicted Zn-dependent peptidase